MCSLFDFLALDNLDFAQALIKPDRMKSRGFLSKIILFAQQSASVLFYENWSAAYFEKDVFKSSNGGQDRISFPAFF